MRFAEYGRIERAISASDGGGVFERWRYGRRLLCDLEVTTPAGNFRHGALEKLTRASGGKLSERELQRRLQCGRTYPKQSQIRQALADFRTWNDLHLANFPPYDGDPDELPFNPLETRELVKQHETQGDRFREDGQYDGGGLVPWDDTDEGALIPRDTFPGITPMREIDRWTDEELELASRHVDRAHKRRRYVDSLIKAINGDLNATLDEAERRLHDGDD